MNIKRVLVSIMVMVMMAFSFNTVVLARTPKTYTEYVTNKNFYPNDSLVSLNGKYKMIFQEDGNLVVYNTTNLQPIWTAEGAYKDTDYVVFSHTRGLECIKTDSKDPYSFHRSFSTEVSGGKYLYLRDNGNLDIYSSTWQLIWSSKTYVRGTFITNSKSMYTSVTIDKNGTVKAKTNLSARGLFGFKGTIIITLFDSNRKILSMKSFGPYGVNAFNQRDVEYSFNTSVDIASKVETIIITHAND